MKQNDIAILLICGFIAAGLSLGLSSVLFGHPSERKATVEVVQPISSEFNEFDNRFVNNKAINPTQLIEIERNKNDDQIFQQQD